MCHVIHLPHFFISLLNIVADLLSLVCVDHSIQVISSTFSIFSIYSTSNMVSSGKHPKRQRDTSLDLPDISHFCSSDLDEVLYPERHQSEATHHQQQQQQRHDEILYQNPCDLFDVLPLEIVLEIFKHLDIESLSNAIKTCRRWRYVIQETECLWKWFCFHYYQFPEDVQRDWQEGYSWQVIM